MFWNHQCQLIGKRKSRDQKEKEGKNLMFFIYNFLIFIYLEFLRTTETFGRVLTVLIILVVVDAEFPAS